MLEDHLDKYGLVKVKDQDFNLSVNILQKDLCETIKRCSFLDFPNDTLKGCHNLVDVIQVLSNLEQNHKFTSKIYELLPTLLPLYAFISSPQLRQLISHCGLKEPSLGTSPLIRIDRPQDTYFSTPWHQDSWFSFSSKNSIVIWIPLCEITADHGYLKYSEGSHSKGMLPFSNNKNSREPYKVLQEPGSETIREAVISFGEILVFRQTLLHKSGVNQSNGCRISLQLRFNDMHLQPMPFCTFTASHSQYVKEKQVEILNQ